MTKNMMTYLDTGQGFPILLGHSYLFDKSMWAPQIDFLSARYRLIIPDLWGHGESPALPADVHNLNDLARDHLRLMDLLGIGEFAVAGLSVGGMWAAELAALAPDRVRALVLMDSYMGSEAPEELQKYAGMLDAVERAGAITSPLLEYIVSQFYSTNAAEEDTEILMRYLSGLPASVLRESIVPIGRMIFGRPDRLDVLDRIRSPVLVAHGEQDLPRPPAEGRRMAEKQGCDFSLIPEAGHISNRENPAFVNALVGDFFDRHLS
ncbi:alpha/beta fold hydrolase (plasmid) [Enterobacter pasteurii]|uniref:alpha/beta fold hydrolase n=1 Tax=Enterobacter pasteurii TaxID=3029761 RepID=UPI0011DD8B5F|nr:alpha/beta fold hydrolase [Enterobacter pasteurii]ELK6541658.1 alpha/beta fold hydrolase [Enterobacter bugandensis]QLA70497.1 alpha/beta fold hydrolase [Enterobacter pasteurii]